MASSSKNKRGLGRGLGALFESSTENKTEGESVQEILLTEIIPMKDQPRTLFDEEKLEELAASIRENGVIQPILLTKTGPEQYQIIAGERRWRAAQMAELKKIPAIVRDLNEEERMRQALIENIQREDLNPMEAAQAYQVLMDEHKLTQDALAKSIGKSRSAIANTLRLCKLPKEIQEMILKQELSEGHARTLLALDSEERMLQCANKVKESHMSVRELEAWVKRILTPPSRATEKSKEEVQRELSIKKVEEQLSRPFGCKVKLRDKNGKGEIRIPYKNLDELDRLIEIIEAIQ